MHTGNTGKRVNRHGEMLVDEMDSEKRIKL